MALTQKDSAKVFWFSGLSGAGKTTWARYLQRYLSAQGTPVCLLDGDMLRQGLNRDLGYSLADREENIRRACEMTQYLIKQDISVVAAFMTPTQACRQSMQKIIPSDVLYEIYCQCSINMCEVRDPKGFYHRARVENLSCVVGWDLPFVPPPKPALVLDTEHHSIIHNQGVLRQFISPTPVRESAFSRLVSWP
jgi:adenylyl-sulfate kinase